MNNLNFILDFAHVLFAIYYTSYFIELIHNKILNKI
jgi:hypothetical protein